MNGDSHIFDKLQERNQQVLRQISQLQQIEKDLYDNLDNVSLSKEQKQVIIKRINENSQIRMHLYSTLGDMFAYYRDNVEASRTTLGQSITAIEVLENELNETKIRMNALDEEHKNKLRSLEINTYYGKRYNTYSKLMKLIIIMCIPIIILAFLANKGLIDSNVYIFLVTLILVTGSVIIGLEIIDIYNRDDMNWDEYNWHFNKSSAPTDNSEYAIKYKNPWPSPSLTCIGQECCYAGSTYDSDKNVCIPNKL